MTETYTVKKLASLAGITPRTLRHYDSIGLLVPERTGEGDYRIYTAKEVDRLQEILLYRELGMSLSEVRTVIDSQKTDRVERLSIHLDSLVRQKMNMELLIKNVKRTIESERGDMKMSNDEKFEGLKKKMIHKNEKEYGKEIREKWGDETIDESNRKMMNMSKEDFEGLKKMSAEINLRLEKAVTEDLAVDSEEALEIAKMHRKWLDFTWPEYDSDSHLGLVEMYVSDERFRNYYDSNIEGCAEFLKEAVINMILNEEMEKGTDL